MKMEDAPSNVLRELGLLEEDFLQRGLMPYEEASDLVIAQEDKNGRIHELVPDACHAWHRLKMAAKKQGHDLFIVSAFRSVSRQAEIIRDKQRSGISNDAIFAVSAPPGFSEHHTGRAIDISTPGYAVLEEEFEHSPAFHWLEENAQHLGFSMSYPRGNKLGYLYEPWHWCYDGKNNDQ